MFNLQVKSEVYALTNIEVRHQEWSGWPDLVNDEVQYRLMRYDAAWCSAAQWTKKIEISTGNDWEVAYWSFKLEGA